MVRKETLKVPQLESLRQTTSTKRQVLEKIQDTPEDELRSLVPGIPKDMPKKAIIDRADEILNGHKPLADIGDPVTEAIILQFGRPALFIRDGKPKLVGADIEKWKSLITNAMDNLNMGKDIRSIGRIETENLPGYNWVGTGWLAGKDLLITNRHVAQLFAEQSGTTFRFQSFFNKAVAPRIDFLAEYKNDAAAEFVITDCLYIAGANEPDVSAFRVRFRNDGEYEPLLLSDTEIQEREDIAVVGYPAFDSRVTGVADMERIYKKIYDVKRFAPGKVSGIVRDGVALHDATTLGGNSGSAVLSLTTGKVIGLHFAGLERQGNFFVTAPVLKRLIDRIPKRSSFVTISASPQPASEPVMEMVPRQCKLESYMQVKVPSFKISGRMVAYASPDSTYSVTKKFFRRATESILIGIYDLSAVHMVSLIEEAVTRGVKVSLMLDIDSKKEQLVFQGLKEHGIECVEAPSCASKVVSYFSSSHEKVIVIDEKWTMIQSGNYSNNSIPFNEGDGDASEGFKVGNRDMGIAIESVPLARFMTRILRSDMQLQQAAEGAEAPETLEAALPNMELLIEAPPRIPDPLFASQQFHFSESVEIQPVLSPDNYMDVVPELLRSAKRSIRIEQQYIRVRQKAIKKLLDSIDREHVTVQIIVANPLGSPQEIKQQLADIDSIISDYGFEVRLLSKKHFVHCHNKLIVIDDEKVLISSQNWSDSAVLKNREAGVIVYNREVTEYYSQIFDADWTMSDEPVEETIPPQVTAGLEAFGRQPGKYLRIDAADIQEV